MSHRAGVKPGVRGLAVGMVAGCSFVILGVTVIVPIFEPSEWFGSAAAAITVFCAYNLFSSQGALAYEVNVESRGDVEDLDAGPPQASNSKRTACFPTKSKEQERAEIMRSTVITAWN